MFKIALLTGGPSLERGISLNSARSVLDHLDGVGIEIIPIYFDSKKNAYKISKSQLYSNTPSDFDFKLSSNSTPLTKKSLIKLLKTTDIVFPAMHGAFGEDGQIQSFLEKNNIPFVGSGSNACKTASDKYKASRKLKEEGFFTLPSELLKIYSKDNLKITKDFFKKNSLNKVIVKPVNGGSSIGVFSASSPEEVIEKAKIIFSKRIDTRVIIEPYAKGREFTVIIIENKFGIPTALMTTEIEPFQEGQIFSFRKKYLPTNHVKYHCPARFDINIIEKIQIQAEQIFKSFGLRDFARFDGWVLDNGEIWFSDFNPISGMEQNSFLFQQSSKIGMSHGDFLRFILKNSCARQNINFVEEEKRKLKKKKPIAVLFGGKTSERQVSLMSGTNIWLKLLKSEIYEPKPYILDFDNNVWELPYSFTLNHTVEEIIANAKSSREDINKTKLIIKDIETKLGLEKKEFLTPKKISFPDFLKDQKFIFLGFHGGDGENGNVQKILSSKGIKFNGSHGETSSLCMDKFLTGEFIRNLNTEGISIATQKVLSINKIENEKDLWEKLKKELNTKTIIVKPKDDGCSTGVAHLYNLNDFKKYISFVKNNLNNIPAHTLTNQDQIIEMPNFRLKELLFEGFIQTDFISIKNNKLKYKRKSGWVEVTVGLLEKNKKMHALNPSITISEGEVLSLEEKFQGGTGINLTPPPKEIVKSSVLNHTKKLIEKLAKEINLKGYARIDAFMNVSNGNLLIIEVNTLPGLTPSTVIYHQALAEKEPMFPVEFLEKIIQNSGY